MKKQKSKFVYCPSLGHGLEYTEYIKRAKHIADQLDVLHKEGFFAEELDIDYTKMAGALAIFGATIEDVHVPMTEEKAASKWDEMRKMMK
jgi:hypothetical protein